MNMRKYYKLLILLLAVIVTGCSDYSDDEVQSPVVPAGNQGVFFPSSNSSSVELEPTDVKEMTLTIARKESSGAITVPIIAETNDENVFNVPQSVSFASGEKEVSFKVTFPNAAEGVTYALRLAVEGEELVNPYDKDLPYLNVTATRIKWETVEEPMVYVDGTFATLYGVSLLPMYVHAEKAQLGESVRYRFKNAYRVPTNEDPDEDGIYDGYPYNDPGDFDESKDYYTVIEIYDKEGESGEVFMFAHELGVIWGEGMISIGSLYKNVSDDKSKYPLGVLEDEIITFPASSLFFSMANYNSGGKYAAGKPTVIYLTKEAFIAANMVITDFNDLEYEEVDAEVGVFETAAYDDEWNKTLSKAVDIDEENPDSDYKDLYYLSDLYAKGYGVAFYHTGEKVRVPENQPIGVKIFGQDVYVSQSKDNRSFAEVNDKGVTIFTLGLIFHYKDGSIVGDFEEKYYYSEEAVEYTKADFIGNFLMTGQSQFAGSAPANMKVKIAAGTGDNLIITGIDFAKEVKADFDASTATMSIKPQVLADFVSDGDTYDAELLTRTSAGVISETAAIDFVFHIAGNMVVSSTSEATGYLIWSDAVGGWVDGYRNLFFTPTQEETAKSSDTKSAVSQSLRLRSNLVQKEEQVETNNFRLQGKKSTKVLHDAPTNMIF